MAAVADVDFHKMTEAQLRQWVEAGPGRANSRGARGWTPLGVAVQTLDSLPIVLWLLDEKGADVEMDTASYTPVHRATSLAVLNTLLDRGADPIRLNERDGATPLMTHLVRGRDDIVVRLLEDPRVRAAIDIQDGNGNTAFHLVSKYAILPRCHPKNPALIAALLLRAGANPTLANAEGDTPTDLYRKEHPSAHAAIALLERAIADARTTSLLVKARCLVTGNTAGTMPSHLQGRLVRGLPLPSLVLLPVIGGGGDDGEMEAARKLRTLMVFLLGMEGGPENTGMPRDVFRVVLDLLMPMWDPLRRKGAGKGPPLPRG